jgi:spore germination protein YaaH
MIGLAPLLLVIPALLGSAPLAHFYYVEDAAAFQSLEQNASRIELLSPVWIHVDRGGRVRLEPEARVEKIAAAHDIAVMPVVMNTDFDPGIARETLRDEALRNALADRLAAIAVEKNYYGLQLDFENLEAEDRDGYAELARRLGAALHRIGKKLSVAVAAPVFSIGAIDRTPDSWQPTPRSAAFDYARLGEAADLLTLMAYDQYVAQDTPGPVAGITWVEACIRELARVTPAEKILLGLPFYHRHWAGSRVTTGAWAEAKTEAIRANVASEWDAIHEESVIRWQNHIIWFHDSRSLARRLHLVSRHGLRGFSAWRLGQEDPSVWPALFPQRGRR